MPPELLWNGKLLAALLRFFEGFFFVCLLVNLSDSNMWKLKLGQLSLELRVGFPAERAAEVQVSSLRSCGLAFSSHLSYFPETDLFSSVATEHPQVDACRKLVVLLCALP